MFKISNNSEKLLIIDLIIILRRDKIFAIEYYRI